MDPDSFRRNQVLRLLKSYYKFQKISMWPVLMIKKLILQAFMVSELEALKKETLMPVYVVSEDEQLLCMYSEVKLAAAAKSASILVRGKP